MKDALLTAFIFHSSGSSNICFTFKMCFLKMFWVLLTFFVVIFNNISTMGFFVWNFMVYVSSLSTSFIKMPNNVQNLFSNSCWLKNGGLLLKTHSLYKLKTNTVLSYVLFLLYTHDKYYLPMLVKRRVSDFYINASIT